MRDVLKELKDSIKWKDIGLNLGLYYPTLVKIEKDNDDLSSRKREMLAAWLNKQDNVKKCGGPTWEQLVEALREVGDNDIADTIKDNYVDN